MNHKKIIFVIDVIKTGGAEKILLDFRDFLQEKGYEISVFVLYGEGDIFRYGLRRNSTFFFAKVLQQMYLWFKFFCFVKKEEACCVFSFLERSNILTSFLPVHNLRRILTVHNILSIQYEKIKNDRLKQILFRFIRFSYNIGEKMIVIAVSDQVKNDLIDNIKVNPDRMYVVNNGVDVADIISKTQETITEFIVEPNCTYILNIGRFTLQKAQWKLIKAFSILIDKGNINLRLLLLGEGELKEELEKLIETLHLKEYVLILPFSRNPYKFMRLSDVMVLPSLYEGFPIVLSEASVLGLPVIGSDKAIPQEIFDDVKMWKNYVYKNVTYFPDYSSHIYEDDVLLAELIEEVLSQNDFAGTWSRRISKWRQWNSKDVQFDKYAQFIDEKL